MNKAPQSWTTATFYFLAPTSFGTSMLVYIYLRYALTKNCFHVIFSNYLHSYSVYSLSFDIYIYIYIYIYNLNSIILCTKIFVRYVFRQHNARNVGWRHTNEHRKRNDSVCQHFVTQTDACKIFWLRHPQKEPRLWYEGWHLDVACALVRPQVYGSVTVHTAVKRNKNVHIDGLMYRDGKMLKYGAWVYIVLINIQRKRLAYFPIYFI